MQTAPRYTFGKNEKLKSRKQIELLFKAGLSFSVFPFRVVYIITPDAGGNVQAGFSVSTRYFKKAVDRNRVKRLMREGYRLQKRELLDSCAAETKNLDVFFIYTGNELPDYDTVFEKMHAALKRLKKAIHENPAANT